MDDTKQDLTTLAVHQWQCDHFGHLNVRFYSAIFDDAIFVFWARYGLGPDARVVPVTAETRTAFRSEVLPGTVVTVQSRIERIGSKSVSLVLEMVEVQTRALLATCHVVEVFFDRETRQSQPIPATIRERLAPGSPNGSPSGPE